MNPRLKSGFIAAGGGIEDMKQAEGIVMKDLLFLRFGEAQAVEWIL